MTDQISAPVLGADDMLCACAGVRKSEVRAVLRQPGAPIAEFIERTGLAKKCTACALDLDLLLEEELVMRPKIGAQVSDRPRERAKLVRYPARRIDSGFFINRDGVGTTLRVGNYNPPFGDPRGIAEQRYQVQVFGADGRRSATKQGKIAKGGSLSFDFAEHAPELPHGWFVLTVWATDSAHAGTIRPQVAFRGPGWTSSYHTQFHIYAARSGRRSGVQLRTRDGATRAGVSIINAAQRACGYRVTLESAAGQSEVSRSLPALGSEIFVVDEAFPDLPASEPLILRVESEEPTRKNVMFFGRDKRLSVDHFPNLI